MTMKPLLTFIFLLITMVSNAQQSDVKEAFLEKWQNSKEYLINMAQAMPEEHYDFSPVEDKMSFKTQLLHIKGNMDWLASTYFNLATQGEPEDYTNASKEEIINALKNSFDNVYNAVKNTEVEDFQTTVKFFAGPKSKLQILNLLQDHVTHHRGQLIVYMNLKNIELPRYSGW